MEIAITDGIVTSVTTDPQPQPPEPERWTGLYCGGCGRQGRISPESIYDRSAPPASPLPVLRSTEADIWPDGRAHAVPGLPPGDPQALRQAQAAALRLGASAMTVLAPHRLAQSIRISASYELEHADLDAAASRGARWHHRPFDEAEVLAHPDGERIRATAVAFAEVVIERLVGGLEDDD
jgi:hypothetical protein